jgi:hypothetical protein
MLLVFSCSQLKTQRKNNLQFNIVQNDEEHSLSFRSDPASGIQFIFSSEIDKKIGDSQTEERNSFSYTHPRKVKLILPEMDDHIAFSSFPDGQALQLSAVTNYVLGFADKKVWNIH